MPRYPVKIESLESRWLLAASAAVDDYGRCVVTATDAGETIALTSDGTTITATVDGTSVGTAAAADVKAVVVKAGAGDDTVTVDAAVDKRVGVSGGDGNDTITV